MEELQWTYERDECWGPAGEPLLSAQLMGDQLRVRVRNSRHCGLEVVIVATGSDDFDAEQDGPPFKVSFDDRALQPLQARVQKSGKVAFVVDVRHLLAELNCTNRLRLHARPEGGGVWLQLDATFDDLQLDRLVEPASGILLVHRAPAHEAAAPVAAHSPRPRAAAPHAPAQAPSAVADLIGAVAPLAAFAAGAKLGQKMFGPGKRD